MFELAADFDKNSKQKLCFEFSTNLDCDSLQTLRFRSGLQIKLRLMCHLFSRLTLEEDMIIWLLGLILLLVMIDRKSCSNLL